MWFCSGHPIICSHEGKTQILLFAARAEIKSKSSSARRPLGRVKGQRQGCPQAFCWGRRWWPQRGTPLGKNNLEGQKGQTVWRKIWTKHGVEQTNIGKKEKHFSISFIMEWNPQLWASLYLFLNVNLLTKVSFEQERLFAPQQLLPLYAL